VGVVVIRGIGSGVGAGLSANVSDGGVELLVTCWLRCGGSVSCGIGGVGCGVGGGDGGGGVDVVIIVLIIVFLDFVIIIVVRYCKSLPLCMLKSGTGEMDSVLRNSVTCSRGTTIRQDPIANHALHGKSTVVHVLTSTGVFKGTLIGSS
jgi:hypothetical protein